MPDSVFFTIIFSTLLIGVVAVGVHRLMFKNSIVFTIVAIMTIPLLYGPLLGLIVGVKGVIHLAWAVPSILIIITIAFEIIAKILQKPLKEMTTIVESLSQGNVDIVFNERFRKGKHELARVIRRLTKLTGSLQNIAAFANHVGKGELNVEYTLLGENDSLGMSMLDMRSNIQKAEIEKENRRQEDERRNWVTQGVAKFAELLRANNDNIEELCHSIVSNLVKYVGANQAGIFILNDDDAQPVLELKACFAYERRKFHEKTIGLGEGIVGTCFLERETIYMTQVPKNYISITSGLGGDSPRALLVVPLKVNEEIYGIIEIAAFKEFEAHQREFIEKVSESIASTIGSAKVSIRTNKLLILSKLQAEEMANNEEELRQNMEEMNATQEEMRRRENELYETVTKMKLIQTESEEKDHEMQQFHAAIFDSCNIIMFSNKGIVTEVNNKVLTIFNGVRKSEFIGKHMSDYVSKECYQAAWEHLTKGKSYEETQPIDTGSGGVLNFHHKYIPINDMNGKMHRILLILYRRL